MAKSETIEVTPLRDQLGSYGMARADEPIELPKALAEKLLKKNPKIWVKGKSDRFKAREAAAKVSAKDEAAAKKKAEDEAAAKKKADDEAAAKKKAEDEAAAKTRPTAAHSAGG